MGKLEPPSKRIMYGLGVYYATKCLDNRCHFIKITKDGCIYPSRTSKLYSDVVYVYKKLKNYG